MSDGKVTFLVAESTEGGYEARAVGFPIFTEAEKMDELEEMVRDAVRCHFDEDVRRQAVQRNFLAE